MEAIAPPAAGTSAAAAEAAPLQATRPIPRAERRSEPSNALATLDVAVARAAAGAPPWQLFDRRVQTHHEATGHGTGRPLSGDEARQRLSAALMQPTSNVSRAIYVHVPFCEKICSFCAFYRYSKPGDHVLDAYACALRREAERLASLPWATAGPIDAIYIGGGTPTTLGPANLAALVRTLRAGFAVDAGTEITVESRCSGVDDAYLNALHEAGVNRLSFGVQSFDTDIRRTAGRIADEQEVLATLAAAHRAGFRQISVDLIYNLPGETWKTWQRDLARLRQTPATAASIYALIPFERSALQQRIAQGTHSPLGGLDVQYDRFVIAAEALTRESLWQRLSNVHYGDVGMERCSYSRMRGVGGDILAIGAGAGGRIGTLSYMNPHGIHACIGAANAVSPATRVTEEPAALGPLRRAYALSELGRFSVAEFASLFPDRSAFVERLERAGLLRCTAEQLTLTDTGCFWAYNIGAMLAELIRARAEEL